MTPTAQTPTLARLAATARRAVARERAAAREAETAWQAYEAATARRRQLTADTENAHTAYMNAIRAAGLVAQAEEITRNPLHLLTD